MAFKERNDLFRRAELFCYSDIRFFRIRAVFFYEFSVIFEFKNVFLRQVGGFCWLDFSGLRGFFKRAGRATGRCFGLLAR